jgi:hypothetical protein
MSKPREVWVMEIGALGDRIFKPGVYLQRFDVNKVNPREAWQTGDIVVTNKLELAMKFGSLVEVLDTWKTQSTLVPLRPDGEPNRPLSALTISPKKVS